jgi:hypothetical protein
MSAAISQDDEEEKCPICLEALSLRLAGEKPHVVPICGHQLRTSPSCRLFVPDAHFSSSQITRASKRSTVMYDERG